MKHKNKKFIIHPFTALFFIFTFFITSKAEAFIILLSAFLHEMGHYFCAVLFGYRLYELKLYPYGADMRFYSSLSSYYTDICVALSGPFLNIILGIIGYYFNFGNFFVIYNLFLCILNLMPVRGLDGGTVLYSLISQRFTQSTALIVLDTLTFFALFLMWFFAVFILFVKDGDPSLFVISVTLFFTVFIKRRQSGGL